MASPLSATGTVYVMDEGAPTERKSSSNQSSSMAPPPSSSTQQSGSGQSRAVPQEMRRRFANQLYGASASTAGSSSGEADNKPPRIPVTATARIVYNIDPKANVSVDIGKKNKVVSCDACCSGKVIGLAMQNAVGGIAHFDPKQALVESISLKLDNRNCNIPLMVKMNDIAGLHQTSHVSGAIDGEPVSTGNFSVEAGDIAEGMCYIANPLHREILRSKAVGSSVIHTNESLREYEDFETVNGKFVHPDSPVFDVMKHEFSRAIQARVAEAKDRIAKGFKDRLTVPLYEADMPAYENAKRQLIQNTVAKAVHHADLSKGINFTLMHADGVGFADLPPHIESSFSDSAKSEHANTLHHGVGTVKVKFYVDLPQTE